MNQLQQYIPFIERMALLIAILWQRENIKSFIYSMLGEPGTNGISSKRVVLVVCLLSFVHLCWFVVKYGKTLDPNILWAHVAIIVTSATIATLPQLGAIIASIKGMVTPPAPEDNKQTLKVNTVAEVTQP